MWALAEVWAGQLLIFAYLIAYIIYHTMDLGGGARALLTNLLPVSGPLHRRLDADLGW